jgi:membrane protease YdiL (CAAX protease family)
MKKLGTYFLLAYLFSWIIWLPLWLPYFGITGLPVFPYHHYFGSVGPMFSALMVSYFYRGPNGVKDLVKGILKWKVNIVWYAASIGGLFFIYAAAGEISELIGGQKFYLYEFGRSEEFPQFSMPAFFLFNLITFGIGEEVGWRGFALPILQKRFNAFTSTVILTVFWAAWHAPAFLYRPNYSSMNLAVFTGFFFSLFMGSVILTWLYNSTKGSILIVALFHTTIEMIFTSKNVTPLVANIEGAFIMAWALTVLVAFRQSEGSRKTKPGNEYHELV